MSGNHAQRAVIDETQASIRLIQELAATVQANAAAVREYTQACEAAVQATRRLTDAVKGLNGTEGVVTIRFAVNDTAVIDHPLLGDAAEAILEGRRGDHS